jgi:AsmA protein
MIQIRNFNWKKLALTSTLILGGILILMAVFPVFFKEKTNKLVRDYLNQQVTTDVSFNNIQLTFFRQFPTLTISVDGFYLQGASGFKQDTLLFAQEISFGVNLLSVFGDQVQINKIFLNRARINILRDVYGNGNFEIFEKENASDTDDIQESGNSLEVNIQQIKVNSSSFLYQDTDLGFICHADDFNYKGKGNFSASVMELVSNLEIGHFDLIYGEIVYLDRKKVKANLRTKIDTESTSLYFERNSLHINEMPVEFIGKLEFIPGGYDLNFVLESVDTDLKEILSLIPESLGPWLKNTRVRGKGDLRASFQGLYLPDEGQIPNLIMSLNLKDGLIRHQGAPEPMENINFDLRITIPSLLVENTILYLDTLSMRLGNGYMRGKLLLEGFDPANINSSLDVKMNLSRLNQALGIDALDLRGYLSLDFRAKGIYSTEQIPHSYRQQEYRTASFPVFDLKSQLENGFIQWRDMPVPIEDMAWKFHIQGRDSDFRNISLDLDQLQFQILGQKTSGNLHLANLSSLGIDGNLNSSFDLGLIEQIYPLEEGFDFGGELLIDFKAKGNYHPEKKEVPVIHTAIALKNGLIRTPYSEEGVIDLSLMLDIHNDKGSYSDLKFFLHPVSFTFADHPFSFIANLENLEDISYNLQSKGRIDLGKLYRTFGEEGFDLDGYLITDFNLRGLQSDAMEGRIRNLENNGKISFEKIKLHADFLPLPINIHEGELRFEQDKLFLENLKTSYFRNEFSAEGFLFNLVAYLTDESEPLKGNLRINSPSLHLEDFLFYHTDEVPQVDSVGHAFGVIMLPENIFFELNAKVGEIHIDSLVLQNFTGNLKIKEGKLLMEKTAFNLIGAQFNMEGSYIPENPFKATYTYQLETKSFDINRAYHEIPMFREMVPAAAYAKGSAFLNYRLAGRLNENMEPVYTSITGEGILGLENVNLKGFRLMNSIAKRTDNDELQDPNLRQVQIRSRIANNIITIERTRMRIAGFRPRFEGQVSLDGDMSIAFRLGLPPLGILGIPIRITGNSEDFKMEIGKITEGDELEETIDNEEVEDNVEKEVHLLNLPLL